MQTYCKQCLCIKNKTTRRKKRKPGRENLAGGVAFAHDGQVPGSGAHRPKISKMLTSLG